MRHAAPVRQGLKLRTIFNLLGPLLNPAGAKRQLVGAYSEHWLLPMAEVLKRGGARHVWAVHGADGMDELSTTGVSRVVELKDGKLPPSTFTQATPACRNRASPICRADRRRRARLRCVRCFGAREGRSATSFF